MKVTKEKGIVQIPAYMRDHTEPVEYNYSIEYKGFEGKILKLSKGWWIISYGKWVAMGKETKKAAENNFIDFVDNHYDILKEKGYIKK